MPSSGGCFVCRLSVMLAVAAAAAILFAVVSGCSPEGPTQYRQIDVIQAEHLTLSNFYFMSDEQHVDLLPSFQRLVIDGQEFEFEFADTRISDVAMEWSSGRVFLLIDGDYGPYVSQLCPSGNQMFVCDAIDASWQPWRDLQFTSDQQSATLSLTVRYGLSEVDPKIGYVTKELNMADNLKKCGF